MQNRYGYFKRINGVYYALDLQSQHQTSLKTRCEAEAKRLIAARNQASDTPQLNRAMAKVYASATSPELMTRTWTEVMEAYASNVSVAFFAVKIVETIAELKRIELFCIVGNR